MMRCILLCCVGAAATVMGNESLTLDPQMMEEAKGRVFGGAAPVAEGVDSPAATVPERWCAAMAAAGTELQPVLLLALLQELNEEKPMGAHAEAYAAALRLHTLAAAGNAQACAELAEALLSGQLRCGLRLFADSALAAKWRMRAY